MAANLPFVSCADGIFTVDGQPFRIAGANNYYLGFEEDSMVEPVMQLASELRVNVIRTWAFLDCGVAAAGAVPSGAKDGVYFHYWDFVSGKPSFNDGPTGLERLDRTIALAEQYGIRLILPLVNYWPDFGGMDQYLQWFGVKGRHNFYLDWRVKDAYRAYIEHVVTRVNTETGREYRDEPAIMAWELANEPRCVGEDGKALLNGSDILLDWVAEMSGFLKLLDPHHLIGVGDEGYFGRRLAFGNSLYNGSFGVDCERTLGISTIDFGTCHLYPDFAKKDDPVDFGSRWIREHIEAGERARKPMLIEEYGWKVNNGSFEEISQRDAVFRIWLDQVLASGGSGALVWMIAAIAKDGQRYPDYDGYTVYGASDVPSMLSFAGQLR